MCLGAAPVDSEGAQISKPFTLELAPFTPAQPDPAAAASTARSAAPR